MQQPGWYPPQQSKPVNRNFKAASISLFAAGFGLKFVGFCTLLLGIGFFFLLLGSFCDIIAFVFLCLL